MSVSYGLKRVSLPWPTNPDPTANQLLKWRFIATNNTKTESINSIVNKGQNNKQDKLFERSLLNHLVLKTYMKQNRTKDKHYL